MHMCARVAAFITLLVARAKARAIIAAVRDLVEQHFAPPDPLPFPRRRSDDGRSWTAAPACIRTSGSRRVCRRRCKAQGRRAGHCRLRGPSVQHRSEKTRAGGAPEDADLGRHCGAGERSDPPPAERAALGRQAAARLRAPQAIGDGHSCRRASFMQSLRREGWPLGAPRETHSMRPLPRSILLLT